MQRMYPRAFSLLLKDQTMSRKAGGTHNIFWATDDYKELGEGYEYESRIQSELITGRRERIIMPRVFKDRTTQRERVRRNGEVFTPSWVCNVQNNIIDEEWFGRRDVFNSEKDDHTWTARRGRIRFPKAKGKTWRDYVRSTRMEMTCGEAPYLVSRYDTVTGEPIPLRKRIGLLDRKLRVVCENTDDDNPRLWREWAYKAYENIYGYEWQGDSLLLARENLFLTFIEYHHAKFHRLPHNSSLEKVAQIISWNIWQMDGLKFVVPGSCRPRPPLHSQWNLFYGLQAEECPGCLADGIKGIKHHNGIYCLVRNWQAGCDVRFVDLMRVIP